VITFSLNLGNFLLRGLPGTLIGLASDMSTNERILTYFSYLAFSISRFYFLELGEYSLVIRLSGTSIFRAKRMGLRQRWQKGWVPLALELIAKCIVQEKQMDECPHSMSTQLEIFTRQSMHSLRVTWSCRSFSKN
jgi:hypothetical protein